MDFGMNQEAARLRADLRKLVKDFVPQDLPRANTGDAADLQI